MKQLWEHVKTFLTEWWRWVVVGLVLAVFLVLLILLGYWTPWTGFGGYSNSKGEWQREKTLWDWLELLFVPVVLAAGAALFTWVTNKREHEAEERRINEQQRIELDRSREAALQTYFDRMTELIADGLQESRIGDTARSIARARTLTMLRQLDGERKGTLVAFLYESGLVGRERIVDLSTADLEAAELRHVRLRGVNLYGVNLRNAQATGANLRQSYLRAADLSHANLAQADLRDARCREVDFSAAKLMAADMRGIDLHRSRLPGAKLRLADLRGAILSNCDVQRADLREARMQWSDLEHCDLSQADLRAAYLTGANLSNANLAGAKVSHEQLAHAKTLQGAILPDGTEYTGKAKPDSATDVGA